MKCFALLPLALLLAVSPTLAYASDSLEGQLLISGKVKLDSCDGTADCPIGAIYDGTQTSSGGTQSLAAFSGYTVTFTSPFLYANVTNPGGELLFTIYNGTDTIAFVGTSASDGDIDGTLFGTLSEYAGNGTSGTLLAAATESYTALIPPDVRDFNYTGTVGAAPEPSSLALLGTGMLGAVGVVRRRFAR